MNLVIQKTSVLNGAITPPSSKSQNIRALFFALLAKGESVLENILYSDDMNDAIRVCTELGASIIIENNQLRLTSQGLPLNCTTHSIYTGNSGITTRFALPLLGLRKAFDNIIKVDAGEQMQARPIQSLVDALKNLGLTIEYLDQETRLPISMSGQLNGGRAEITGITSQFLSALLIALPMAPEDSEIIVDDLNERPYVEMTLQWLKQQKIHYTHQKTANRDIFFIKGRQHYHAFKTIISGDFSSASYFIAAAALIPGKIELHGLDMQDSQGDKRLVSLLQEMGANISIKPNHLFIEGGHPLKGITIDANDIPDLLPTLAVIGTQALGKTEILNVPQARIKETDRIHSMHEGLSRLGAEIIEHADGLTVYPSQLQGAETQGYDDHRTVMALSLAGMLAKGVTTVTGSEAINKTFPNFVELMQSIGANMEVKHA